MMDSLELPFEEEPEEPKSRRPGRRRAERPVDGKRGRSPLALILTVLLLVVVALGGWFGYGKVREFFTTPDYDSTTGVADTTVEIKVGFLGADMARALKAADVVKSEQAFADAYEADPQAKNIQPGVYKIRTHISGAAAVQALLNADNRVVTGVTVQEGLSSFATYRLLAQETKIPEKDFKAAAKKVAERIPDWWFKRTDGKPETKSIEGFLFPDTYQFPPNADAEKILGTMVDQFLTVTGNLDYADEAQKLNISPYQALIVASLAQAEAGNADDLGKVARVAYNIVFPTPATIEERGDCACLRFDVTVSYSRELAGKDPRPSSGLSREELEDPANPYSRVQPGLPPTAINNPGKAALQAAVDPPKGNWLYFVAIDKQGHSAFSSTYEQFCKDNETAVANGVLKSSGCQ
jgi:UPF0755 protein